MRRIEFGIGIGEDKNSIPISPMRADTMLAAAIDHVSVFSNGGFVTRGFGFWRHPVEFGRIIREDAITITIDANLSDGTVKRLARTLRDIFGQTAVHVAITEITAYEI